MPQEEIFENVSEAVQDGLDEIDETANELIQQGKEAFEKSPAAQQLADSVSNLGKDLKASIRSNISACGKVLGNVKKSWDFDKANDELRFNMKMAGQTIADANASPEDRARAQKELTGFQEQADQLIDDIHQNKKDLELAQQNAKYVREGSAKLFADDCKEVLGATRSVGKEALQTVTNAANNIADKAVTSAKAVYQHGVDTLGEMASEVGNRTKQAKAVGLKAFDGLADYGSAMYQNHQQFTREHHLKTQARWASLDQFIDKKSQQLGELAQAAKPLGKAMVAFLGAEALADKAGKTMEQGKSLFARINPFKKEENVLGASREDNQPGGLRGLIHKAMEHHEKKIERTYQKEAASIDRQATRYNDLSRVARDANMSQDFIKDIDREKQEQRDHRDSLTVEQSQHKEDLGWSH